ncbi:PP2C family serine/threonine-protein phosphatase [Pseudoflavitalea rhizosphaerae]|uniref:PP2C family serine/threonine-protein phosphatase n=1 Tax=Pseudoflavitalea rhizosphaerae TaxID=1884793 RepID=UPI000F8E5084|nr:PP2C family serine/threonine-protein phosphatase [Pseudoflavitalea rhizosphaerae]
MIWKTIGQSVTGTSHLQSQRACEDALAFKTCALPDGDEALICCASDGAGSAKHAAESANYVVATAVQALSEAVAAGEVVEETSVITVLEKIYDNLLQLANEKSENINEYSCTLLGAVITEFTAVFFQVGDGAIIRDTNADQYTTIWWPHNGEYSNTTAFLVDDSNMSHLRIVTLHETIKEVALFTDGLQLLTLNNESLSVHQPFFADLFKWLRMATQEDHLAVLNRKLGEYLNSEAINNRTDDDKTLFLATRF